MNDSDAIGKLASERAGTTESLRISWKAALETLPELPVERLKLVIPALPSPGTARQLGRFLSREPDPAAALEQFLSEIDHSGEDIADWFSAFDVFANYIRGTAHRPSLSDAAGYLHCCEAMVDSGIRFETFPMTVQTMLETYGYEGNG